MCIYIYIYIYIWAGGPHLRECVFEGRLTVCCCSYV